MKKIEIEKMRYTYLVNCLLNMYVDVSVDYESIFRSSSMEPCKVHTNLNRQVGLLRIFPSMSIEAVSVSLFYLVSFLYKSAQFAANLDSASCQYEE